MKPEQLVAFFVANRPSLLRFARGVLHHMYDPNPDIQAEEAIQQAFVNLLESSRIALVDEDSPGAYVYQVVRNAAVDAVRIRIRRREGSIDGDVLGNCATLRHDESEPERTRAKLHESVRAAFRALEHEQFTAIQRCWRAAGSRKDALLGIGIDPHEGKTGAEKKDLKNAAWRAYDGPLHEARKALLASLPPLDELVQDPGIDALFRMVNEVLV